MLAKLVSSLLLIIAPFSASMAEDRMNVLFIAVDDMRVELGCYGSSIVQSPNLDALAARGLLFERAYCQQAVCNPSRASLLTGLSVDHLGIYDLPTHFREKFPDVVTLPQMFKHAGYQTHGIGKIFHNFRQPDWQGDAVSWSSPERLHYGSHSDDVAKVERVQPVDQLAMLRVEKRNVPDSAYLDGRIAVAAVEQLRELANQPFFLAVGFWKPHLPFNAPAKYWDLYSTDKIDLPSTPHLPENAPLIASHDSRELMRSFDNSLTPEQVRLLRHGYYAAISYVDAQIGKVLDELDRLDLRENTIVVFWSDHGFHLGEHDLWCKNSNFELDARVPLIISVPDQSTAGRRTKSLVELLDLYPTLADYCSLQPPHKLDGFSLRAVLDDCRASVRDSALTQNPRPAYPGRAVAPETMGYTVRTALFRYTEWRDYATGEIVAQELYDHRQDPLETESVALETEYATVVAEHGKLLESRINNNRNTP